METLMKRIGLEVAMVVGLVLMAAVVSAQETYCWVLEPFSDDLRLTITQADPVLGFYEAEATWNGLHLYQLQGGGKASIVPVMGINSKGKYNVNPGQARIDLLFTTYNGTDFFGGNDNGTFHASIGAYTFTGLWTLTFTGENGVFINRGNLVPRDCGGEGMAQAMMMRSSEREVHLAGQ